MASTDTLASRVKRLEKKVKRLEDAVDEMRGAMRICNDPILQQVSTKPRAGGKDDPQS